MNEWLTNTYLFFSVYASIGCEDGDELRARKPNALALSTLGGFQRVNDSLLFVCGELYREIATQKRSGRVRALRPKGYCTLYPLLMAQTPPA